MKNFVLVALIFVLIKCSEGLLAGDSNKPNVLIILSDDQDVVLDGMTPMENVQKLLGQKGITFKNAYTSSPICCPSRASLLTGLYAHNHHTRNNSVAGGCYGHHWKHDLEKNALPVVLQDQGYETFFAGKYLNQYYGDRVPPGWSYFHGLHGNSKYYNYTLNENGVNRDYNNGEYLTDHLKELALKFFEKQGNQSQPFFGLISVPAPHAPFTPAERHRGSFAGIKALKTPNFNKLSQSTEKHWLVSSSQRINKPTRDLMDQYFQQRWETLLSVDELVGEVIKKLEEKNLMDNTYVIYTSDNGYHMGQFAQPLDKRQPYETDIKVPLLIRGPHIPIGATTPVPVALLDIFPTILEWAKIPLNNDLDGISFNVFISNALNYNPLLDVKHYRGFLIEHWGEGNAETYNPECPEQQSDDLAECTTETDCHCQDSWNNTYSCIRNIRYETNILYCEFRDQQGFIEAYDLNDDPFEMKNIAYTMLPIQQALYSLALANLTHCSGPSCWDIPY